MIGSARQFALLTKVLLMLSASNPIRHKSIRVVTRRVNYAPLPLPTADYTKTVKEEGKRLTLLQ